MNKNKIGLAFIAIFSWNDVSAESMNNDTKFLTGCLLTATAITAGIVYATSDSNAALLQKTKEKFDNNNLSKYDQVFDTEILRHSSERDEEDIHSNLKKLGIDFTNTEIENRQCFMPNIENDTNTQIIDDAHKLKQLSHDLWFRSFFYSDIAAEKESLDILASTAEKLFAYHLHHNDFFIGTRMNQKYMKINSEAFVQSQGDIPSYIKATTYSGNNKYPMELFTQQINKDRNWINDNSRMCQQSYPTLSQILLTRREWVTRTETNVKNSSQYAHEKQTKAEDQQDALIKAQLETARAATINAQTAKKEAEINKKRLKLDQDANKRAELRKQQHQWKMEGYSDAEIARFTNNQNLAQAFISLFD